MSHPPERRLSPSRALRDALDHRMPVRPSRQVPAGGGFGYRQTRADFTGPNRVSGSRTGGVEPVPARAVTDLLRPATNRREDVSGAAASDRIGGDGAVHSQLARLERHVNRGSADAGRRVVRPDHVGRPVQSEALEGLSVRARVGRLGPAGAGRGVCQRRRGSAGLRLVRAKRHCQGRSSTGVGRASLGQRPSAQATSLVWGAVGGSRLAEVSLS